MFKQALVALVLVFSLICFYSLSFAENLLENLVYL